MKKAIGKMLLFFFFCIGILFLKNQYSYLLLNQATYGMPALIKKGYVENLYMGSSMFRQGLDIDKLKEKQESNYILTYNGNQPVMVQRQLEYVLDKGVEIKNLYIDMYVYSAWEAPEISDEKIFLEIDLKEKIKLWKILSGGNATITDFWRMFVSSNNELLLTWPMNYYILNSQFEDGGAKTKTAGRNAENLEKMQLLMVEGNINSKQKESIEEIIHICEENGIRLIFVETPKYQRISRDISYQKAMKEYVGLLEKYQVSMILTESTAQRLEGNKNNIAVYSFFHEKADFFIDTIHLSYEGRKEFTNKLTEIKKEKS